MKIIFCDVENPENGEKSVFESSQKPLKRNLCIIEWDRLYTFHFILPKYLNLHGNFEKLFSYTQIISFQEGNILINIYIILCYDFPYNWFNWIDWLVQIFQSMKFQNRNKKNALFHCRLLWDLGLQELEKRIDFCVCLYNVLWHHKIITINCLLFRKIKENSS